MNDGKHKIKNRSAITSTPGADSASVSDVAPVTKSAQRSSHSKENEVAAFIAKMNAITPVAKANGAGQSSGRLIFAMDATMSRQPAWDMALSIQSDMFSAVQDIGGLDVQLLYFRGFKECRASKWAANPAELTKWMQKVQCLGGRTQIGKVLLHTRRETETQKVNALVFVGDAMEENIDDLCHRAGELSLLGVPAFLFLEGYDRHAETAFREIARLTKGAFCRFDSGSADQLRALLSAVAVFAAGGRRALEDFSRSTGGQGARQLIEQMK